MPTSSWIVGFYYWLAVGKHPLFRVPRSGGSRTGLGYQPFEEQYIVLLVALEASIPAVVDRWRYAVCLSRAPRWVPERVRHYVALYCVCENQDSVWPAFWLCWIANSAHSLIDASC